MTVRPTCARHTRISGARSWISLRSRARRCQWSAFISRSSINDRRQVPPSRACRGSRMPRYSYNALLEFGTRLLEAAGSPSAEAAVAAESLLEADARGVASHGYTRLGAFAERLRRGIVRPGVTPKLIRDAPAFVHVDGGNGMGNAVARQSMALG